jgi:hypothetical protein
MIIVIVRYWAEIVIEILIVDRYSLYQGAGRTRRRRRSVGHSQHDFKKGQVTSMKKFKD